MLDEDNTSCNTRDRDIQRADVHIRILGDGGGGAIITSAVGLCLSLGRWESFRHGV